MAGAAARMGAEGGWLHADQDAFAPEQIYLGPLDAAAKAYGGVVVGAASDPWIQTEREGRELAVRLAPIDLGNGQTAWIVVGRLEAVDCR